MRGPTRRLGWAVLASAGLLGACMNPPAPDATGPGDATEPASSGPAVPTQGPGCPASGARVTAGTPDAAMGFRAVVVTLTNCGDAPYAVSGYPRIEVLDADGTDLQVTVEHEPADPTGATGAPDLVLEPGDDAVAALSWRNTVLPDGSDPQEGAYVSVIPSAGEQVQTLPMLVDIGTTGQVAITPWRCRPPSTSASARGNTG